jgi:hypothetical protein
MLVTEEEINLQNEEDQLNQRVRNLGLNNANTHIGYNNGHEIPFETNLNIIPEHRGQRPYINQTST